MTTWILVLTLMSPYQRGGYAVESVPGFVGEAACIEAGRRWVDAVKTLDPGKDHVAFALCAKAGNA